VSDAAREVSIVTRRSARFYVLGGPADGAAPGELWVVLHGYGQLAGRFVRHFREIASARRMIVAPEALNRFYVAAPGDVRSHREAPVGATWMTREDREREIEDQHAYLDAVIASVGAGWPRETPRLVVLGFSQGVATAVRWAARTDVRVDRLIAWAGGLPAELDAPDARRIAGRLTLVAGSSDALLPRERVEAEQAQLTTLGIDAPLVWFDGGHVIDGPTLARLATGDAARG
jgi:predicted esterase